MTEISPPNLWIDCDDTLIIYKDTKKDFHAWGLHFGEEYNRNEILVEQIEQYRKEFPNGSIVVWSGGGRDYARDVVRLLMLEHLEVSVMLKTNIGLLELVRPWDIVIDDMDVVTAGRLFKPQEFWYDRIHLKED